MTDDEIDAAIRTLCNLPSFREVTAARTVERDHAIFRAGMSEAARIAREKLMLSTDYECCDSYNIGIDRAVDAIERAVGGEG